MKKIHYYFGISAVILAAALIIISLGVVDAPVVYTVSPAGDEDYLTIAAALAAAEMAGTSSVIILLSAGTYSPDTGETFPIDLDDYLNLTNITISGTGPSDGTGSIIDAGHTANVIYSVRDDLPVSLKLENLQVTGGTSTGGGGGIHYYSLSGSLNIENCTIKNNESTGDHGGGIRCATPSLTIKNSTVIGNKSQRGGGGISIQMNSPSSVAISDTIFTDNSLDEDLGLYGGGLHIDIYDSYRETTGENNEISISRCIFSNNSSHSSSRGMGGAIFCGWSDDPGEDISSITIKRCIFSGNVADSDGGALKIDLVNTVNIENSLFTGNTAGDGSAIFLSDDYNISTTANIINCTFDGNIPRHDNAVVNAWEIDFFYVRNNIFSNHENAYAIYSLDSSPTEINNNAFFNNLGVFYDRSGTGVTTAVELNDNYEFASGNIDVDPLYVDINADNYHLRDASPCIDAGMTIIDELVEDLDGNPRPSGGGYDIGAYERQGPGGNPPVAHIEMEPASGRGPAPLTVTFDGRGSSDPDGDTLTHRWEISGIGLVSSQSTFTYTFSAGTYTVTLTVSDGSLTNSASKTVVAEESRQSPVAIIIIVPEGEIRVGDTVNFNGTHSYDPDGSITSYDWRLSDRTILSSAARFNYFFAASGSYEVTLTVTDNEGLTGVASVTIDVLEPIVPPTACIETTPAPPMGRSPFRVVFSGECSVSGDEKPIDLYEWESTDGGSGVGENWSHEFFNEDTETVEYTVQLRVWNDRGENDAKNVEVTVLPPLPPLEPDDTALPSAPARGFVSRIISRLRKLFGR